MYNPELLARNFRRAHSTYNHQATVQQELALQVVEQILVELAKRGIDPQASTRLRLVDLGAGTNLNLLSLLLEQMQQTSELPLAQQHQFWLQLLEKEVTEPLVPNPLLAEQLLARFAGWSWDINIVDLASIPEASLARLEQLLATLGWQAEIKVYTQSVESWLATQLLEAKSWDLVISSACLQWLEELPLALQQIKDLLAEQGKFIASLFIAGTMRELQQLGYPSLAYWQARELNQLLLDLGYQGKQLPEASPSYPLLRVWEQQLYFPNVREILRHFKLTGVNNLLAEGNSKSAKFWTRKQLQQLETAYQQFAQEQGLPVSYVGACWVLSKAGD